MIKSPGKKIKIAVFISGTGSNLNYTIKLVVSNKRNAKGLIFAKKYKIPTKVYYLKKSSKDEKKILDILLKKKIKLICLAGFMKILSSSFIKKFKGKIVNIHPSLLPKYKGLNTHTKVLNN